MLQAGKAVKVTIYLSEGATHHGAPVYSSILDFLFYRRVAGATVTKGIAGFGADHHMHTAALLDVSEHLPVKIEFIEAKETVDALLGKLSELCGSGLIEIQETTVAKPAQTSKEKKAPLPAHMKIEGKAQMMRIFLNEDEQWHDKPLHEALVEAMRANDVAGVTVFRGVLGYGAHGEMHKEKGILSGHHNPVMLSAVDTREKLQAFLPLVDQMMEQGLVVLSDADIIKYAASVPETGEPISPARSGPSTGSQQ